MQNSINVEQPAYFGSVKGNNETIYEETGEADESMMQ
jgi:hypothetical protein